MCTFGGTVAFWECSFVQVYFVVCLATVMF